MTNQTQAASIGLEMTPAYEATSAIAGRVANRLLVAGFDSDDIAMAFVVAGVATARAARGDDAAADLLDSIAGWLRGED